MRINQETGLLSVSLVFGLLLMTFPGPPLDASESHPKRELLVTDFTSSSADLGWYVQNDNVMGGRSEGDFKKGKGELIFAGDGRRYTWQLQTNARWRGNRISYWADFETRDGEWTTVKVPFSNFFPQFRGFRLDGPKLDPREIRAMGLYIYDKQDGRFELHMDSVKAYSAETP
jgi:hypothetical protein